MKWCDKNFGLSPFDPDYDDGFDAERDRDEYERELEERAQMKREE